MKNLWTKIANFGRELRSLLLDIKRRAVPDFPPNPTVCPNCGAHQKTIWIDSLADIMECTDCNHMDMGNRFRPKRLGLLVVWDEKGPYLRRPSTGEIMRNFLDIPEEALWVYDEEPM